MSALHYHVIDSLQDDYLEAFLDRFQDDFPANEQVHVSYFIRRLKKKEQDRTLGPTLLCALEGESGPLVGMACYDIQPDCRTAILWYIAIAPEKRNMGLGSELYQEIVRRVQAQSPFLQFLVYEVERPDQAHTSEAADIAQRRIEFYRLQGAKICTNLIYWQQVRNEPRIMMYLLVDNLRQEEPDTNSVLETLRKLFGQSIEPMETLILE